MKYLKALGIAWGLIYFDVGAIKSFTVNSNDTWASVALLFALFLLPLPLTIAAVWLPRISGPALLGCVAVSIVSVVSVVVSRHASPFIDMGTFVGFIALYNIPHLLFGMGYIRAGQASRRVDSNAGEQSVQAI